MESRLGTRWRESIEDMLDRMETGRTRGRDMGRIGNQIMNYLNLFSQTFQSFKRAKSLNPLVYKCKDIFKDEQNSIFKNSWVPVGYISQFNNNNFWKGKK